MTVIGLNATALYRIATDGALTVLKGNKLVNVSTCESGTQNSLILKPLRPFIRIVPFFQIFDLRRCLSLRSFCVGSSLGLGLRLTVYLSPLAFFLDRCIASVKFSAFGGDPVSVGSVPLSRVFGRDFSVFHNCPRDNVLR